MNITKFKASHVYSLYDKDNTCLYVGMSSNAFRRFGEHAKDKSWFQDVTKVIITNCDGHLDSVKTEQMLIAELKPKYNNTPFEIVDGEPKFIFDKEKEWAHG